MLLNTWHRIERWFVYNVIRLFRVRSGSEPVARGFTIGLVLNFVPTFGFGVLISGLAARMIGGSTVAGLVGGALLSFFWPALFYLNLRVGSLFLESRMPVDEVADVNEKTMSFLMSGQAFTVGAILNSIIVAVVVYPMVLLTYERIRPTVMACSRRHARVHQRRFRRLRSSATIGS